jgi:hypothetical protein
MGGLAVYGYCNPTCNCDEQDDGGCGGYGGKGGNGGRGGHGGGGGGGPSIGIFKGGNSNPTLSNVTYFIGSYGSRGTSSGNNGQNGISREVYP